MAANTAYCSPARLDGRSAEWVVMELRRLDPDRLGILSRGHQATW
jgi:hypothetical protein